MLSPDIFPPVFILRRWLLLAHLYVDGSSAYKPSRQTYKGPEGETPVVDRVSLFSDKNNNLCIKFMIRHTRRPEVRIHIQLVRMQFFCLCHCILSKLGSSFLPRLVTSLVADMVKKEFVAQLFNRKISHFLNVAYVLI